MFKNPTLNKFVYAAALLLTVAVFASLPYGPLSWEAMAQSYLYDNTPTGPLADIVGNTFVTEEEVYLPGTTAQLETGGLIIAEQDEAGGVTILAGGIQALLDPTLLNNTFTTQLASGEIQEFTPAESNPANLDDRLILTGSSNDVTLSIYYLYTAEGTRVFQVNVYINDVLRSNRLLLFAEADDTLTWVVRAKS